MQIAHDVSPETHVFVGTFRPPMTDIVKFGDSCAGHYQVFCPMRHFHYDSNGLLECWRRGCFDTPVYKTIEEVVRMQGAK